MTTIIRARPLSRVMGGFLVLLATLAGVSAASAGDNGATLGLTGPLATEKFSLQEGLFGLEARDDEARREMLDRQSGFLAGSYSALPMSSAPLEYRGSPALGAAGSGGDVGGYLGYWFRDAPGSPSSIGVNLGILGSRASASGGWSLQPGIDYARSFYDGWYLKTRLFTTYGASGGPAAGPYSPLATTRDGSTGGGFNDLGLGMGVGYSLSNSWGVQTQARYQRQLRGGDATALDKQNRPNQFFGGVMLDYKF